MKSTAARTQSTQRSRSQQSKVIQWRLAMQQQLTQVLHGDDLGRRESQLESGVEEGFPEPPEMEDAGDSQACLSGESEADPYDSPRDEDRDRCFNVLRQPVQFRIDEAYAVHAIPGSSRKLPEARRRMAEVVAGQLKRTEVVLREPGDWMNVPAIDSSEEVLRLAATGEDAQRIEEILRLRARGGRSSKGRLEELLKNATPEFQAFYYALDECGPLLKATLLQLPNGDVVAAEVMIESAGKGIETRKITKAAMIRLLAVRPQTWQGHEIKPEDWKKFDKTLNRRDRAKPKAR